MESWIRYINKATKYMTVEEVLLELKIQRYFKARLKAMVKSTEASIQKLQQSIDEAFEEEGEEMAWHRKGGMATKRKAVLAKECRKEYLEMLLKGCEGTVESLEATLSWRRKDAHSASEKSKKLEYSRRTTASHMRRTERVDKMWNKDAIMLIAEDRGYRVEEAFITDMAKELEVPYSSARLMLNTGRFTWGQVLNLGSMLEMTPREFAETFMRGYFAEVADGQLRAWASKDEVIYTPPPKVEPVIPPTVIRVDESGEPIGEVETTKFEFDTEGHFKPSHERYIYTIKEQD